MYRSARYSFASLTRHTATLRPGSGIRAMTPDDRTLSDTRRTRGSVPVHAARPGRRGCRVSRRRDTLIGLVPGSARRPVADAP